MLVFFSVLETVPLKCCFGGIQGDFTSGSAAPVEMLIPEVNTLTSGHPAFVQYSRAFRGESEELTAAVCQPVWQYSHHHRSSFNLAFSLTFPFERPKYNTLLYGVCVCVCKCVCVQVRCCRMSPESRAGIPSMCGARQDLTLDLHT